jgi:DNA-binding transcriptional LysR family regulator
MRSLWEAAPMLRSGKLRLMLAEWSLPPADIYAVFPTRSHLSAKTRALVDYLLAAFEPHRKDEDGGW